MTVDIDQVSAGIELDILVAEALGYVRVLVGTAKKNPPGAKTFVFTVADKVPSFADGVYIRHVSGGDFRYFAPSTDIAAAWTVVQALNQQGYTLRLAGPEIPDTTGYLIEKSWSASFVEAQYVFTDIGQNQGRGSTPSLAICRAALKVMASKEESTEADCQHEFFQCQVPAGDSCVAIYHDVCRKCRWDKRKGVYMPLDIWRGWALPQLEKLESSQ